MGFGKLKYNGSSHRRKHKVTPKNDSSFSKKYSKSIILQKRANFIKGKPQKNIFFSSPATKALKPPPIPKTTKQKYHIKTVHQKLRQYRCKVCNIFFSQGPNLAEHIGVKHMGYKSAKEWRSPENKYARQACSNHEAYEFIPLDEAQKETK